MSIARLSRLIFVVLVVSGLLMSCASPTPQATNVAPAATEAPAAVATSAPPTVAAANAAPVTITIWSHWVDEPTVQKYLREVLNDYEASHPNVKINIEFSQKDDFLAAAINAFTVGEGGPDIFYVDKQTSKTYTIIDAGWAAPLEDVVDWSQMSDAAKPASTWKNAKGETHTWIGEIDASADMILYNPQIFDKLGIKVPDNYQFTADEFYNVVKKCREGGYDPFATGSGDRKYPGQYLYYYSLISRLGMDDFVKLWNGETSWNDPIVKDTLNYVQKIVQVPAFPSTFSTMSLAESFQYFHTKQKACMFTVGTWYTGRAFSPSDQGGQPSDFRNGFLRYPAFPDGKGTDQGNLTDSGAFAVWKQGPHVDVAKDIIRFMLQEKYGTKFIVDTGNLPMIKYDPSAISDDNPHKWYWDGFNKSYSTYKWTINKSNPCADLYSAYEADINDGLAAQLLTVDQAVTAIDAARVKCPQP